MNSNRDSAQRWLTAAVSTRLALRPALLPTQILLCPPHTVFLRPCLSSCLSLQLVAVPCDPLVDLRVLSVSASLRHQNSLQNRLQEGPWENRNGVLESTEQCVHHGFATASCVTFSKPLSLSVPQFLYW